MERILNKRFQMPIRDVFILYGILVLLVFGYFQYIYVNMQSDIRYLERQIEMKMSELRILGVEEMTLKRLQDEYDSLVATIERADALIPVNIDRRHVVRFLYDMADKAGVNLLDISFSDFGAFHEINEEEGQGFRNALLERLIELPVNLKMEGTWENLYKFIYSLFHNTETNLVEIRGISISPPNSAGIMVMNIDLAFVFRR